MSRAKAAGFFEIRAAALQRLREQPLPACLVLAGDDPWVKERLITAASERARGELETFALQAGESESAGLTRLIGLWQTRTLFQSALLIIVRGADGLVARGRLTRLEGPLELGESPHHLLLCLESLDGRTKFAKRLQAEGGLVSLPPLRDGPPPWHRGGEFLESDLNRWVCDEAEHLGLRLDLRAADALTRRVGNEPAALSRKVEQLGVLVGTDRAITVRDIERHVRFTSARLLHLFEDALRQHERAKALTLLDRMLAEGVYDTSGRLVLGVEAADTVLRGLVGNLARLLQAHGALDEGLRSALDRKPWERSEPENAALSAALGAGGRRVFLERDLRALPEPVAAERFRLALAGLRALRDGRGLSLHALCARLLRVGAPAQRS
ncbi:MAG: DNA polymerase III subunit delta [Planctomycetota bacterium]